MKNKGIKIGVVFLLLFALLSVAGDYDTIFNILSTIQFKMHFPHIFSKAFV